MQREIKTFLTDAAWCHWSDAVAYSWTALPSRKSSYPRPRVVWEAKCQDNAYPLKILKIEWIYKLDRFYTMWATLIKSDSQWQRFGVLSIILLTHVKTQVLQWAGLEARMHHSMTLNYKIILRTTDLNVWSGVLTFVHIVR